MNLDYLRTFLAVSRAGSFSEAAKQFGISQPAVSFQIGKLERELGTRIFERGVRGISLTPAGARLVTFAELVEDAHISLSRDIETLREEIVGLLEIGASTIPGEYLLPEILSEFKARHPAVGIQVRISDSRDVIDGVRRGRYPVGFCGVPPVEPDLICFPFAADEITLIVYPEHPLAVRARVTIDELEGEAFIFRASTSGTQESLETLLTAAGYDLRRWQPAMMLGSTQAVISAVERGAGIAFVSSRALERSLAAGALRRLGVSGVNLSRKFYCLHRREGLTSRLLQEFVAFVEKQAIE